MRTVFYIFRWVITLSVTIVIGFFGGAGLMKTFLFFHPLTPQTQAVQKVLDIQTSPSPTVLTQSPDLQQAVDGALLGTKGTYAVVFKNLSTGETFSQNDTREYETASLYKLWVMAAVYRQIAEGKINKTDILKEDITTLNQKFKIASESAERTEGSVTTTVQDALRKMITYSDNYSALILTAKIRLSSVSNFLTSSGFSQSHVGTGGKNPSSTAHDIALFFEKLYRGELTDQESTREMLDLLKAQQLNGKIPKYLPSSLAIAHKTGELDGYSHDGGIIYTPQGNYILVILSESTSRQQADERLAGISKAVYTYVTH